MKEKSSKGKVWLNYLWEEKRAFLILFGHIAVSAVVIWGMRSVNKHLDIPAYDLKVLDSIYKWLLKFVEDQTFIDGVINPISATSFALAAIAVISGLITFVINMFKERFDATFMDLTDQKRQNLFFIFWGFVIFAAVFFIFLATNFFNVVIDYAEHADIFFFALEAIMLTAVIIYNGLKLKEQGRSDILTFIEALFIVTLLICYPIKDGSFFWVVFYDLFMIIISFSLMARLETIYRNDTAIYYFFDDKKGKQFIHYRLDDDRVVCSNEPNRKLMQKRYIFSIDDLCKKDISKDTSNYDESWKKTITAIRSIREMNAQEKRKRKIAKAKQPKFAGIKRSFGKIKKKLSISRTCALYGYRQMKSAKELKRQYKEAESKLKEVSLELEELKNQNKGA